MRESDINLVMRETNCEHPVDSPGEPLFQLGEKPRFSDEDTVLVFKNLPSARVMQDHMSIIALFLGGHELVSAAGEKESK